MRKDPKEEIKQNHVDTFGKSSLGKRNREYKGPRSGIGLVYSTNSKVAVVAGAE